ncbi:hypothetical protein BIV09_23915 [Pseudomonas sp. 7SR1]|nr:hypothetical protein BIV09_23915 [Pseudomonas sp. 7SR1]
MNRGGMLVAFAAVAFAMGMLHAARGGRRWLKIPEFFSLLGGLSGVAEVKAPLARVATLAASGRWAATATTFTSATAPATGQGHNALLLDFAFLGDPVLASAIKPESCKLFRLLVCRGLYAKAMFRTWVCDRPHNFWHTNSSPAVHRQAVGGLGLWEGFGDFCGGAYDCSAGTNVIHSFDNHHAM